MFVKIKNYTRWNSYLASLFPSLYEKYYEWQQSRRVRVVVKYYDVFDLQSTLTTIILPSLKRFRTDHIGGPLVANIDVPKELRMTRSQLNKWKENGETDDNWFKRYEYVLDEMIWAFENIDNDDFYTLALEEQQKLDERVLNGLRLFGKYYRSLWI